jgi:hypothetical protein
MNDVGFPQERSDLGFGTSSPDDVRRKLEVMRDPVSAPDPEIASVPLRCALEPGDDASGIVVPDGEGFHDILPVLPGSFDEARILAVRILAEADDERIHGSRCA